MLLVMIVNMTFQILLFRNEFDGLYLNYRLPKDTTILSNSCAIHRNERDFAEPNRFGPGLFIQL